MERAWERQGADIFRAQKKRAVSGSCRWLRVEHARHCERIAGRELLRNRDGTLAVA